MNTFLYVESSPVMFVDPEGLVSACMPGESCTQSILAPSAVGGGNIGLIGGVGLAGGIGAGSLMCPVTEEPNSGTILPSAEHTKGKRPSTEQKHQEGRARQQKDYGGEKGDANRRPPKNPPTGWKGPWPPKEN